MTTSRVQFRAHIKAQDSGNYGKGVNLTSIGALALLLHRRKGAARSEAFGPVEVAICIEPTFSNSHLAQLLYHAGMPHLTRTQCLVTPKHTRTGTFVMGSQCEEEETMSFAASLCSSLRLWGTQGGHHGFGSYAMT